MLDLVREFKVRGRIVYQCELCDIGYSDPETADRCEEYCNAHDSCSLEITKKAVFKPETESIP